MASLPRSPEEKIALSPTSAHIPTASITQDSTVIPISGPDFAPVPYHGPGVSQQHIMKAVEPNAAPAGGAKTNDSATSSGHDQAKSPATGNITGSINFHGAISGSGVVAGNQTTGGTAYYNFGAYSSGQGTYNAGVQPQGNNGK